MAISSIKERLTPLVLILIYMAVVLRYFPGDLPATLRATLMHMGSVVPFAGGLTFLVAAFLRRGEEKPPWTTVLRLYITFGIMIEFFLGLYDYLSRHV